MADLFSLAPPAAGTIFNVRVRANAAESRLVTEYDEAGMRRFRIYVTAQPVKGKSNAAMLKLLGEELGVPPARLAIRHGQFVRDKMVEVLP